MYVCVFAFSFVNILCVIAFYDAYHVSVCSLLNLYTGVFSLLAVCLLLDLYVSCVFDFD